MARLLKAIQGIEGALAVMAYLTVVVLLGWEIIAREVMGMPVLGLQTMAVLVTAAAGFFGMSLATGSGSHLRPTVCDRVLPARFDALINRISDMVAALLHAAFAIVCVYFISETQAAGDRVAIFLIPVWPFQLVMPAAFLSSGLRHLIFALKPGLRPVADSP
ncbi:TRAP transporter small permease [Amaricoccus tamworthensis]|uniref:TRAP transporter small permease n=1 Tax=Amaricoccus tamworthensis TaxID=57002 RepID=UPI003C79D145